MLLLARAGDGADLDVECLGVGALCTATGMVKQSWPSRPGARAASQRASPGGLELSRGAVSRAVGGRRERACVLSVQQVCCTACWQAVQIWSDGGARARRPPRAACRRARLARWSCVVPGAARSGTAWCLMQVCRRLAKGVDCQ